MTTRKKSERFCKCFMGEKFEDDEMKFKKFLGEINFNSIWKKLGSFWEKRQSSESFFELKAFHELVASIRVSNLSRKTFVPLINSLVINLHNFSHDNIRINFSLSSKASFTFLVDVFKSWDNFFNG